MPRHRLPTIIAAATVALAVSSVSSDASSPSLRAHSIFTGGASSFHVGAIAEVDGVHRRISKLCVTPAPIDRPSCSASNVFAPSATGTTRVRATFAGGRTATLRLRVRPAATKLGGRFAVIGAATCAPTRLFGNYDRRHHRLVDGRGVAAKGQRVALYNRVGVGRLAWVYGSNKNGFAKATCIKRLRAG